MGRNTNATTTETKNKGIDFAFSKGANSATGKIWETRESNESKFTSISINLNGLVIKGCSLVQTKDGNSFISFPSYKNKNGEYVNLVFMVEKEDIEFLRELSAHLVSKL